VVQPRRLPNLGIGIDSYHSFATRRRWTRWRRSTRPSIFLVQLSDFMWQESTHRPKRIETARTFRVFPGEGVHSDALADAW
jgi:hypothetical protein